ncbi:hypothetical protein [Rubripirellula tenax]|uniref:hypothetical protein n=1 Tax=Rubripirellula tenax TaxID=2528015 RepID=UPI001645D4E0|nr:hypothetical protein [Rubripirellula tenax]
MSTILVSACLLSMGCGGPQATNVADESPDKIAEYNAMRAKEAAAFAVPAEAAKAK